MRSSVNQLPFTPSPHIRQLWLRWYLAAMWIFSVGCVTTGLAIDPIQRRLGLFFICTPEPGGCVAAYMAAERTSTFIGGLMGGIILALVAGRYHHQYLTRSTIAWWAVVNSLGMALAFGAMYLLNIQLPEDSLLFPMGTAAVGGAIIAIAQWMVLRQKLPYAQWWIPAVSCTWASLMFLLTVFVRITD